MEQAKTFTINEDLLLLYGGECFTGNQTTRRFHTPLHPGPKWRIFRMSPL